MTNQKPVSPDTTLGDRLFEALTQVEIAGLLNVIFDVLSPDGQRTALEKLPPDTRQTVQHVLSPPPPPGETETRPDPPVSVAKLAQTWQTLWDRWYDIVDKAADEEGEYVTQEAHWEPPYFDQYAFAQDLETVTKDMRPLLETAVEYRFSPDMGFAEAIMDAEADIAAAMPEWIYLDEGFGLEANVTYCLLMWEWLKFKEEDQGAFAFVELILGWENDFSYAYLEGNTLLDFFTELPDAAQREIFEGFSQNKEADPWKSHLASVYSHWHILYMHYVDKFAPERYVDNLRQTIPNQWRNGIPVIEDLLDKEDYEESLKVVQETLPVMLKAEHVREAWTPESRLLSTLVRQYHDTARLQDHKRLLDYYRQISKTLGHEALSEALSLQRFAFDHCFDWQAMFNAFAETPVAAEVRQALFASWREYIVRLTKPSTWHRGWVRPEPRDTWWLLWLIDSIVDTEKGPAWFQQKMTAWLTQLPGDERGLGEDYDFLRILTNDLSEIDGRAKAQYPKFYGVVIRPRELKSSDATARRDYLKRYAAADLLKQVMGYWQAHLKNFVPRPENVEKSDYTRHANWMTALRELDPDSYQALLENWRVEHHRRRNLWKAMAAAGLIEN